MDGRYNYKRLKVTKTFVNKTYQENMETVDINIQIISDYYNLGVLVIKDGFMTIFNNHNDRSKMIKNRYPKSLFQAND